MKTTLLLTQKLFLSFLLVVCFANLNAQDTITNQNFERWEPSGKQPPFDWEEPQGWTTSNPLTEFISAGVSKTQMPQSGSTQAQIKTLNVFGQPVPGVLINGNFTLKISDTADFPLVGGEPMTTVKSKLYGMYNFTGTDTADSARIIVAFKKFNNSSQKAEAVAIGAVSLSQTTAGLHLFTIDINTLNAQQPDSVVVTILSTKNDNIKDGGVLTVDFVSFDKPTRLPILINKVNTVKVYPSPATNTLQLQSPEKNAEYSIYDVTGKVQLTGKTNATTTSINIEGLTTGVYFITVNSLTVETLKFIKQ